MYSPAIQSNELLALCGGQYPEEKMREKMRKIKKQMQEQMTHIIRLINVLTKEENAQHK